MNILLIGNGFDLAHGLPTRYADFINFLRMLPEPFPEKISPFVSRGTLPLPETVAQNNLAELKAQNNLAGGQTQETPKFLQILEVILRDRPLFRELWETARENFWIDYFRFAEPKPGWIGLENDLGEVIQTLETGKAIPEGILFKSLSRFFRFSGIFEGITPESSRDIVWSYIRNRTGWNDKAIECLYDDLRRLTRCFEIYLATLERFTYMPGFMSAYPFPLIDNSHEPVSFVTKRVKALSDHSLWVDGVLSFNYTDTAQQLYFRGDAKKYCYIHGKAERKDDPKRRNRMVIGMDEYLPEEERSEQVDYIMFRKYYQRIYEQTDYNYTEWLKSGETHNLYIIGHSLERTDEDVLRELILHENVTTTVYYRDRKSNGRQIQRLIQRLGAENLNLLARGSDKRGRLLKFEPLVMEDIIV